MLRNAIHRLGRQPRRWLQGLQREEWVRWAPLVLALIPALVVSVPIVREIPFSYDHATHLFKAWHFWTALVPSGRLSGWSPYWAFGFPSDELVPCGGELWVGLFRALTLGSLPWDRTYAIAFAALMWFKSFAAFAFARRYFGANAGVLCAWITLLDPGGANEGGWNWHTYWGVWPVTLAVSLAQLCLLKLERVLEGGPARDVLVAGLCFGAGLVTHQIVLVMFMIVTPFLFLDHTLRERRPSAAACLRAVLALGVGGALSAFYLVPFMSRTSETMNLGWLHEPLAEISKRFLEFRVFKGVWTPIQAAAVAGMVLVIATRRRGAVLFAGAGLCLVFLASDTLVRDLHLERALSLLIKVEVNRLLLVAKLFWFPLAAHALVQLFGAKWALARANPRAARWANTAVFGLLGLGVLWPNRAQFYETQIKKPIYGQESMRYWRDFQPFIEWSRRLRASTPEFYRIAFDTGMGDHLSTAMPVYNQTPMYKVGSTPAQIFDKVPAIESPDLFVAANVRYIVTASELKWPSVELKAVYGALKLYEFTKYTPNPFTLLGHGSAQLVEWSAERLVVRLQGTTPQSRLKLHIASYPRWEAQQNGRVLPIATVTVAGAEDPFLMEVPVADGELVVEYVSRWVDWLGRLLSLAALPGFALLTWTEKRFRWGERFATCFSGHWRWWLALVFVGVVSAGGVMYQRTRTRAHMLPPTSVFQRLQGPELEMVGQPCQRLEPLVFQCGPHRVQAETVTGDGAWGVHMCMQAPDVGPLSVRIPTVAGAFVKGSYVASKDKQGRIIARFSGKPLGNVATRSARLRRQFVQFDTREAAGQTGVLELDLSGATLNCFDFQILSPQ